MQVLDITNAVLCRTFVCVCVCGGGGVKLKFILSKQYVLILDLVLVGV